MIEKKIINLIPRKARAGDWLRVFAAAVSANKKLRNILLLAGIPVVLTLVQMMALGILDFQAAASDRMVREAKTRLSRAQSQALQMEKQKSDLLKEEAAKRQRLDYLLSSSSGDKKYAEALAAIGGLMPKDLWINEVALTDGQIQITGAAVNSDLIIAFTDKMDKSGFFKNSIFSSSEKQSVESYTIYNFQVAAEPVLAALAKS